jgi:AraC-like DNA-binding protein
MRKRAGIQTGGGGATTTLISGWLHFEDAENRLLNALPPMIHVPNTEGQEQPWLEDGVRFLTYEITKYGPGAQSVINHLVQILFIQAVRAHVTTLDPGKGNWLRAVLDPDIGQVLALIHSRPEAPWTVSSLAASVAMSRSAFAAKFAQLAGEPPLAYLTTCRMQRAAALLSTGDTPVKRIATKVGYESEAAFSIAFKRSQSMAPGAYRKLHKRLRRSIASATSEVKA